MASQYALRFETGERRGELVPIVGASMPGRAFTIGRKPGNSLQVTDASVSGRHAELFVDEGAGRVSVRDLGSTNGTHVAGSRVEEADLGHGDAFLVGKVRFTVVDRDLDAPGSADASGDLGGLELELDADEDLPSVAPVSGAAAPAGSAEGALEISAADLARSRRSSRLAPIALVAAAAAAAAAFVLTRGGGGGEDGGGGNARARGSAAVQAPAGFALSGGYSFESSGLEGWTEDGGEISTFEWTSAAANTGRRGLRAELRAGQRARLASDPVRVSGGDLVRIAAAVRVEGDAAARIGLDHGGGFVPLASTGGSGDFAALAASGAAPGSADGVRVVVEVTAGGAASGSSEGGDTPVAGTVDVDDVSLVLEEGAARTPAHETGAWSLHAQSGGDGAARALSIDWRGAAYAPLLQVVTPGGAPSALEVRGDGDELLVTARDAGELRFVVDAGVGGGGVATLGDPASGEHPGYAQHGASFDAPAGATSLLVGADASQMRVRFEGGRVVSGRPRADDDGDDEGPRALVFSAPIARGETLTLQFEFSDERALAERLARRARQELSSDQPGVAFATWAELLDTVPYSSDLVAAAGTAQSRITAEGREALAELRDEVERARFFRLGDLFREKLVRARELQRRYAGSEVAALAGDLAAEIEEELALLERTSVLDEAARLSAIRAALERAGAAGLAGEVERYRDAVFPDAARSGGARTNDGSGGGAGPSTPDGGGL